MRNRVLGTLAKIAPTCQVPKRKSIQHLCESIHNGRLEAKIEASKASLHLALAPSLNSLTEHASDLIVRDEGGLRVCQGQYDKSNIPALEESQVSNYRIDTSDASVLPCVFCCEAVCVCGDSSNVFDVSSGYSQPGCACGNDHFEPSSHTSTDKAEANDISTCSISSQQRARIESNRSKALAIKHARRVAAVAALPLVHLPATPEDNASASTTFRNVAPLNYSVLIGNNSQLRRKFKFGLKPP